MTSGMMAFLATEMAVGGDGSRNRSLVAIVPLVMAVRP